MKTQCQAPTGIDVTSDRAADFPQDEGSWGIVGVELEGMEEGPLRLDVEDEVRQGEYGAPDGVIFHCQSQHRFWFIVGQERPQVGHGKLGVSEDVTKGKRYH